MESDQETTGRTVVGMFASRADAESAIRDLKSAGFSEDRIGVAVPEDARIEPSKDAGAANDAGAAAGEGAAAGALSGGVVGGLIGLLGSVLVPGLGPLVVGGVLASTLTGAGIGAATGGLVGALMGLGIPEEDARRFDEGLRSGGALVTVSAGRRTDEALRVLQRHGVDLGSRATAAPAERRRSRDSAYAGPERRTAGV